MYMFKQLFLPDINFILLKDNIFIANVFISAYPELNIFSGGA